MAELPIRCADCDKKHWSVASMMTCDCSLYDRNGYPVRVKGSDWLP